MIITGQVTLYLINAGAKMCQMISTCIVKRRGLLYHGVGFSQCINKIANGKGTKWKMGRLNNRTGCTKSGKLINGQGAIRAGRVSNFVEKNKRACPFIRQVRVDYFMHLRLTAKQNGMRLKSIYYADSQL